MKQDLRQRQSTKGRVVLIVGSSSIVLLIVVLMFVLNIGNIRHGFAGSTKRTVTTIKDGNWNDNSIWSTGSQPVNYSSDSIVILNNVNFNVDFTVGNQSKTGIYIGSTGNLTNNGHTLTLEKSASLTNNGTLQVKGLSFNGNGATDPTSTVINTGSLTLNSTGLNSDNPGTTITNTGTMTINGASKINGTLTNSGTITISGNFDSDYGTFINSGIISATGTSTFTGATLKNTTANSSFSDAGLTLNYGSNTNSISKVINSGKLNIGTSNSAGSLTINDGTITNGASYVKNNGPAVTLYGNLTINSGGHSDTNRITNNGRFTISQSVTAYGVSAITDNDSMTIGTSLNSYTDLTVNKYAYLGIGTDFTNNSGTYASLNNNGGYIYVAGNFTNNWGATYTGNGGGLALMKNLVNHSTITGNTDICDKTPNTSSDVNGTMGSNVSECTFVPPTSGPSALPVTLTKFTAQKDGSNVVLNWTTASEINNDRFEIERSENGADFSVIGTVKGNGTKNTVTEYTFTDESPLAGIGYYRLHQFDFNSNSSYSPIAVVHNDNAATEQLDINVYPNPVHAGNTLHAEMTIPVSEMLTIDMIDMKGVTVYHNAKQADSGKQNMEIEIPANLKGMYILNITYRGQTTSKKVQVQ